MTKCVSSYKFSKCTKTKPFQVRLTNIDRNLIERLEMAESKTGQVHCVPFQSYRDIRDGKDEEGTMSLKTGHDVMTCIPIK